ncbi:9991_t:CDS:2, partial [Scutellospora calospora]
LSQAGFLIPAGSCPSVGIGGHALGGGFGLYSRKFSVASDNILSIDMIKADGLLITANANKNEDLFFALRGAGGNNYGIVTSFTFQLHPTPPNVTSLSFQYEVSNIQKLLDTINKFGLNLPDDVTLSIVFSPESLELNGVYLGSQKNAKEVMKNFISSSNPSSTKFIEESFFSSVVRWGFEGTQGTINPTHHPNDFKAKSFLVKSPGLSSDAIKSLQKFMSELPSDCPTFAEFDLFGGAINRVAPDATAFVHRDILYGIQLYMELNSDSITNTGCIDKINKFGVTFQNDFSSYQNYIDKDLVNWQKRYYGSNFPKLVDIKKKFDPDNVFKFPQSI